MRGERGTTLVCLISPQILLPARLCQTLKTRCVRGASWPPILSRFFGNPAQPYRHRNLGTIATLGIGRGAFQSGRIGFTGFFAWLIHRAYHLYAVPTLERKIRVLAGWLISLMFGRDIVSVEDARHPRIAFLYGGIPQRRPATMCDEVPPSLPVSLRGGA